MNNITIITDTTAEDHFAWSSLLPKTWCTDGKAHTTVSTVESVRCVKCNKTVNLIQEYTQARNQRHALLQWPVVVAGVRQHLDELIADLDRRVAALEAEIAAALQGSVWAEPLACLTSAPGIGLVTASWLLVGTLNFALCAGPEALTAYVGLAPVPRESGRRVRSRPHIGHDGNARLRTALYMATLSAAGKPPKVARCAAARKLLHQAWALGSKRQRFDPDHKQQQHEVLPQLAA